MEFILNSENFKLELYPKVCKEDISYPNNTNMSVTVKSYEFCGSATMYIDIKDLAKFADDLYNLYNNLYGEAYIEEPYGTHMYISFVGDGKGHIDVKGYLCNMGLFGNENALEFSNSIDQTYIKSFCYSLQSYCKKYI